MAWSLVSPNPRSPGEEEQGSMAEVSYYSYEYDPDSDPFLADAEGGDNFDLPEGGGDIEQKGVFATDIQLPTLDTKNTPERWYELQCFFLISNLTSVPGFLTLCVLYRVYSYCQSSGIAEQHRILWHSVGIILR